MKTNLQETEHAEKAPRDIGAAARHALHAQRHKRPGFTMIATTQQNMTTDLVRYSPSLFHALSNSGACMSDLYICCFFCFFFPKRFLVLIERKGGFLAKIHQCRLAVTRDAHLDFILLFFYFIIFLIIMHLLYSPCTAAQGCVVCV